MMELVFSLTALGVVTALVSLWVALRESRQDLDSAIRRLTALEVSLDQLKTEQDKLAVEWGDIFTREQKAWDAHVSKITQEVTVQLAMGSSQRRSRTR